MLSETGNFLPGWGTSRPVKNVEPCVQSMGAEGNSGAAFLKLFAVHRSLHRVGIASARHIILIDQRIQSIHHGLFRPPVRHFGSTGKRLPRRSD